MEIQAKTSTKKPLYPAVVKVLAAASVAAAAVAVASCQQQQYQQIDCPPVPDIIMSGVVVE